MKDDRRKQERLSLRLPVVLFRANGEDPIASETLNISADGFYCTAKIPFAPGDRLQCRISLPKGHLAPTETSFWIDAAVEVVRVTLPRSEPGFGCGCRILDYRVVQQAASS
jgi:hypothetical protein